MGRYSWIFVAAFAIGALILTVSLVQAIGDLLEPADVLGELEELESP